MPISMRGTKTMLVNVSFLNVNMSIDLNVDVVSSYVLASFLLTRKESKPNL